MNVSIQKLQRQLDLVELRVLKGVKAPQKTELEAAVKAPQKTELDSRQEWRSC